LIHCKERGIKVVGGSRLDIEDPKDFYVEPAIVEVDSIVDEMMNETFAPILYVKKFNKLTDAINMQNDVTQGIE
jgi:aldehyde dehydrogenase (NAD+)